MVSIITVNYNQTDYTCALLDSIRRQDFRDIEVFVVDNASRENPSAIISKQYPEVHVIRSEVNLGFAGGNNLAVHQTQGGYLFFVNNDAEITEGCIAQLLSLFKEQATVGIASPLICYFPEKENVTATKEMESRNNIPDYRATHPRPDLIQYAGMPRVHPLTARSNMDGNHEYDLGQYALPFQTGYAHGAAMMVRREVLEQVGPMNDDFFLYYEEVDWCERIHKAGWEVWVEPRAKVYHKESATLQAMSSLKTYYLHRNRIWLMRRNYGGWRLAVFYAFFLLVSVPKNALLYLAKGDLKHLAAFFRAISWHFYPVKTNHSI